MEDYNNYNNNEDFYQIPPKPAYPVDNKIYETFDFNLGGIDMNSNLPRPATPTSPMTPTFINTNPRIISPIPRISSPIPRISSPGPRISSPVPRISSPIQRINSPIQRINSPIQRINSPAPKINSPTSRDVANSPLNSNFNYDFLPSFNDIDMKTTRYDDIKGLRNSNSLASLKPQKITNMKILRNSSSTTSLNSLRNQHHLQHQFQQPFQQQQQQFQPQQKQQQQLVPSKPFEITGTPQDQLQKLLIQAKAITSQLQSLSSQDTKLEIYKEGKLPSYEKLVKVVSDKFQVQREINQANARLLTINYIVNITNFCRTHQLHQNIVEGQKKIAELETTIQMLEDFIEDINVENENNKLTAERLKSSLDDTRSLLENAIQEYRKEMDDHRKILKKQNNYIDSIQNSKFNQDLLVDAGIFCVATYIVNLPLIDFPLHSVFQTLMRPGRRRAFTKQLAKLIMIYLIVRKLRRFAVQYGIHNKIGSFSPYLFKIINMLVPAIYQSEIKDMTNFLLKRNKQPEIKKVESLEDMDSDVEIVTQK